MIITIDIAIPSNLIFERAILGRSIDLASSTGTPSIIVNYRTEDYYSDLCIVDSEIFRIKQNKSLNYD